MSQPHLNKAQLEELKQALLNEDINLEATITRLQKQDPFNDPDHANDNAAVDTDVREQMGHETISAEIESLRKKKELVAVALTKMEKGTYGICEKTKTPIPYERLKLVPEARYSIEYERQIKI
ncbi:MAG: General stress protein 16O [Microgenomates bacterium OLB23]|nr:MAG: General stress protein 16O [Microgenomates bacterium OLB23]